MTITHSNNSSQSDTEVGQLQQQPCARKVAISGHQDYQVALSSLLPSNINRSLEVHKLLKSYGDIYSKLDLQPTYFATKADLCKFHDEKYIEVLLKERKCELPSGIKPEILEILERYEIKNHSNVQDHSYEDEDNLLDNYGLKYDCPIFPYLPQYVKSLAGSSIAAARFLLKQVHTSKEELQPISINWNGGRHHSKKAQASGFCYINDINLSILELRRMFDKVAYIDLDLHHGDGVESAFKFSDKVLTISLHRREMGFFPGTGKLEDQGIGKGKNCCVNVPLKHGLSDNNFLLVVRDIMIPILTKSGVEALVIQCGGDGLGSDEYKEWNLSIKGFGSAVKELISLNLPTLLLGGGGYNNGQMARLYTYLTAISVGMSNWEYFDILPDAGTLDTDDTEGQYEFWNVPDLRMKDENNDEYLEHLKCCILDRLGQ